MKVGHMLQLLFVGATYARGVLARLGSNSSWVHDWKPKTHRSIQELSDSVFEELLVLHGGGPAVSFHLPHVVRRVHKIAVEGSANLGDAFGPRERSRALEALNIGADKLIKYASEEEGRHLLDSATKSAIGIAAFTALMVFLTVLLVSNLVNGSEPWPFLGNDNAFLTGAPGASFKNILPCSKLPFASDELFGYLPITQGLVGNLIGLGDEIGTSAMVEVLTYLFNPEALAEDPNNIPNPENCKSTSEECLLTAECCKIDGSIVNCNNAGVCEVTATAVDVAGGELSIEPFCLAWSKTSESSSDIDTIAFAPQFPWPPIEPIPLVVKLLPFCPIPANKFGYVTNGLQDKCLFCQFALGYPLTQFNIGGIRFQFTIQWDGIALSWSDKAKLAYGTNADTSGSNAPPVWDGFRNQQLPEVNDINFWIRLRLNIIDVGSYEKVVTECEVGKDLLALPASQKVLRIILDVELYVAVDRQSTDGNEFGSNLANDFTGGEESSRRNLFQSEGENIWRNMQESATREDPCIILAMPRAAIKLPYFGGNIVFANAIGGYCIFSPEETGTRCSPSGFFFNIENQFRIEGGVAGYLAAILEDNIPDNDVLPPLESAGNSIGIFQDPNGVTEAVVFRLEYPVATIFGIPITATTGRPIVHFQYVKGSEVERRRATLLRKKPRGSSGPFVANCPQVFLDCEQWDVFTVSDDSIDVEICSDILLNEKQDDEKLLYYNRVLTAETVDPKQKYVITPPKGQIYKTPAKYDFGDNLDADVFVVYLAMEDFGNIIILVKEISAALILSDGPQDDLDAVFVRLFCQISVLWFISISVGVILENYADGESSDRYALAGQFEFDTIGFRYSVAISTNINFDRRRHRHLQGEDYRRALSNDGLENADYTVAVSMSCVPGSACAVLAEFFEDVGEAIWDGMQEIATFFTEDVKEFFDSAVAVVGEWGEKFIGSVLEFGEGVIKNLANEFANGEVAELLNSERLVAFDQNAQNVVSRLTDGRVSFDDVLSVGRLASQGLAIAGDFIVAGVTDLVNAIGSFFSDIGAVFEAIGDVFNIGSDNWVEVRHKSSYTEISDCRSSCQNAISEGNQDQIKRDCWCMDEFECPVKIAQKRECSVSCFFVCGSKSCDSWADTPIERSGGFPRYESRAFDKSCRTERMAKVVESEEFHGKMVQAAGTVDRNVQTKFKGLNNFSPSSRRRRKLSVQDGVSAVSAFTVPEFTAVNAGSFGPTSFGAMYEGAQLKPDATDTTNIQEEFSRNIDFSSFQQIGQEPSDFDDALIVNESRLGATDKYLGALKFDDPAWTGRQPIIEAPKLSLAEGSLGTSPSNPVVIECSGSVANAWMEKLESSEPEAMRRRRSRRLQSTPMQETLVEITVLAEIRKKILSGDGVLVEVEQGSIVGENGAGDIFANAKRLIGTNGVGSFMDPRSSRRFLQQLNGVTVADYDVSITTMRAEPFCDRFEWTFDVTISDTSGKKSDSISVHAELPYGTTELQGSPLENIQTICDTDSTTVDDLEDNQPLQFFTGVTGFSPKLRNDNCRSPFVELTSSDTVLQEGSPCTTQYKTIQRDWTISTLDPLCPSPIEGADLASQKIIAGGFVIPATGAPDTPFFELQDQRYNLPNERDATVSSDVSDYYRNGVAPVSQCGICDVEGIPGIVYSHPKDFVCSEVGDNTISVTVLNRIGVSVTKTANARVVDAEPPNMFTKDHTVYLNRFGWLEEEDVVTVVDIDNGSWDNCGIELSVSPTPIYQCNDEGPQTVTLSAVDPSSNTNSKDQIVIVDDSSRLGINDDQQVIMPSVTDNMIDPKMWEDFNFKKCEEIAVFVRPEGDSNFISYEGFSNGVNNKWNIPKHYNKTDDQSVLFYEAFCGGVLPEELPEGELCVGEVKAEVLCEDRGAKKNEKGDLHQTCYRARLVFDPLYKATTTPSPTSGPDNSDPPAGSPGNAGSGGRSPADACKVERYACPESAYKGYYMHKVNKKGKCTAEKCAYFIPFDLQHGWECGPCEDSRLLLEQEVDRQHN